MSALGLSQRYEGLRRFAVLVLLILVGCGQGARQRAGPTADQPQATEQPASANPEPASMRVASASSVPPPKESRLDTLLRVLHVQVPCARRSQADEIWAQLREDVFDSATLRRLNANGVRVGVGRTERWDAIRATLDAVGGNRICELQPVRTPPGAPLALELDRQGEDHTIFYLDSDGIISGDTWPTSRRVLRVTYTLDTGDVGRVYLSVVPEIRRWGGPGWSHTEAGWAPGSTRYGRAFAAAAFVVTLGPNEFVLIAPGEKAGVFGLVGGAFLKTTVDNKAYDSYVFVRADVTHVDQRR